MRLDSSSFRLAGRRRLKIFQRLVDLRSSGPRPLRVRLFLGSWMLERAFVLRLFVRGDRGAATSICWAGLPEGTVFWRGAGFWVCGGAAS